MTRITFNVYNMLARHIDDAVKEWGFQSRADFFRYTALDFILRTKNLIPPQKALEDCAKAVRQVQASRRQDVTCFS